MSVVENTANLKTFIGEYDFAVDGGAISTIPLRQVGGILGAIPNGAVICLGYMTVVTPFTTGSAAQAAITVESAGDMIAAAVVSGAPYSTAGQKSVIPVGSGATSVLLTAARNPSIVITVGTITAGKARVVLFYR